MLLRRIVAVVFSVAVLSGTGFALAADELPRRGVLGVQIRPLTDQVRQEAEIAEGIGVELVEVLPDSAALAVGLQAGDLVIKINGADVTVPPVALSALDNVKAGEAATLTIKRDGQILEKKVTLKGRPLETADDLDVVYTAFPVGEDLLRAIITKPKKASGKLPAVLYVQGNGCESVEAPERDDYPYTNFAHELTRRNVVVMRVEKSGVGDSQGTACRDVDFQTDLKAFKEAAKFLKEQPFVDADSVFVYGVGAGGAAAPMVVNDIGARGVIVFGTFCRTWAESAMNSIRNRYALLGVSSVYAHPRLVGYQRFLGLFHGLDKPLPELLEEHSELRALVEDDEHFFGRHYSYYKQLHEQNVLGAWENVEVPALVMWGQSDIVTQLWDHEQIVNLLSRWDPDAAKLVVLESVDHNYNYASSQEMSAQTNMQGKFHPVVVDEIAAWIKTVMSGNLED